MSSRPRLKPHRRPLRRTDGGLQLGTGTDAVLIDGLCQAEIHLVEALDGSSEELVLLEQAVRGGLPRQRAVHLLTLLREHDTLIESYAGRWDFAALPEPVQAALACDAEALAAAYHRSDDGYAALSRRARRRVAVDGSGSFPAALVALLRSAAVGEVVAGRYAADLTEGDLAEGEVTDGEVTEAALTEASRSSGGPKRLRTGGPPDVVVLAGATLVDPARGHAWRRAGVPHLPVVVQSATASIGPLVLPGRSACLRCMDLTRSDLDASWPALLAQSCATGVAGRGDIGGETSLVSVVAGLSAMMVLGHLDGVALPMGVSLDVGLPWPRVVQRHWPVHPACPCSGAPLPGAVQGSRARQERMAG